MIEVKQIDATDPCYKQCRDLYYKYLGLNPTYEADDQKFWVALDKEKVVGASSLVLSDDEGLLEGIVVEDEYRGQKIGERLTAARIDYAVNNGAKFLTSLIWCHPYPAASRYILEKFGLIAIEYIEHAYVDEIPSERWSHCPRCGTKCICGGLFMACKV